MVAQPEMQITWNFLNDSYRTTLCLQYDLRYIGIGALLLHFRLKKLEAPLVDGKLWWKAFCPSLKVELADHIIEAIYNLYDHVEMPVANPSGLPAVDPTEGSNHAGARAMSADTNGAAEHAIAAEGPPEDGPHASNGADTFDDTAIFPDCDIGTIQTTELGPPEETALPHNRGPVDFQNNAARGDHAAMPSGDASPHNGAQKRRACDASMDNTPRPSKSPRIEHKSMSRSVGPKSVELEERT
eukprot:jgi/Botrbrau1/4269/Bobra.0390s0009.1